MKWKPTPLVKMYEALGALADDRIEVDGNAAKVYSSSRNKYYDVVYDPEKNAITANDNGSFWQGYLGYPAVAFLLATGVVDYDPKLAEYLGGFAWKDINQRFKNDFDKSHTYIDGQIVKKYHIDIEVFHSELERLLERVNGLGLGKLTPGKRPPAGY